VHVPGLVEAPLRSFEDFEGLYSRANSGRKTASTLLNTQSSRSHAVLMIKVLQEYGSIE
jgi:hypothetical protein